ncbi:MAG: hypothetical protein OEQ13_04100 [Acidobacteriota bacterium]|nr:hypothetical protein [Acidobacteriota bacterium]
MRIDLGIDETLLDRFFTRQREEIVARIRREQSSRRTRSSLVALAAATLLAAVLTGAILERGPAGEAFAIEAFMRDGETYSISGLSDPLAAFGAWPEQATADSGGSFLDMIALPAPFGGETETNEEAGYGFPFDIELDHLDSPEMSASGQERG